MASHKGALPKAQPRTLRTIAEEKSAPASFPEDLPYDTQGGVPQSVQGGGQSYNDAAEAARARPGKQGNAADPKPLK